MNPDEIRDAGPVPARASCRCRTRTIPKAAWSSRKFAHRRDQEAGGARPHALRSRLRPAGPPPAGVPGADLPDHAARPRRRVAGQAGHDRELLRAVQRHPEPEAARRAAPAGHAVPAAAVQPDRGPPHRAGRAAASPASTATPTATPTPPPTWSGDIRPQEFRHRIDTPSLRGVNIQRLFGSQRALKTVEDFTEFEQRAAYFDGDPVIATKKGVNILERGSQVHFMAEFQELLDFPPAPKLDSVRQARPGKATEAELRGQELFFGKGQCAACHAPPYLHRQPDAQPAGRAVLQAADDQRPRCHARTARSRPSRCAASRTRRPTCTTAGC